MTRTWNGPGSSPKETGPKKFAAARPLTPGHDSSGRNDSPTRRGDELRQLGQDVIGCGHLLGAEDRLRTAAIRGAELVTNSRLDWTAVATVLSVAAQAAGIGQADALAIIRETFRGAGVR